MESWLSHAVTSVVSLAIGLVPLVIQLQKSRAETEAARQKSTVDEWRAIVDELKGRVSVLETRIEAQQHEHTECLKAQAALQAEISFLKTQLPGRHP